MAGHALRLRGLGRPWRCQHASGRRRATIERGGSSEPPAVAYSYPPGRGAEHTIRLLAGYCEIVQCDGYAANNKQLTDGQRAGGDPSGYLASRVTSACS
jgi:hypothetical protein